jgi:hypothetical protein
VVAGAMESRPCGSRRYSELLGYDSDRLFLLRVKLVNLPKPRVEVQEAPSHLLLIDVTPNGNRLVSGRDDKDVVRD